MTSRTNRSRERGSADARVLARLVLATVASVLCLLLLLAGASFGGPGARALLQPSPSGSGSPGGGDGVTINLLNPAPGYDPQLGLPPRQEGVADPPKISDRDDGVDGLYHIVAWASGAPQGAVAEAYYQRGTGTEQTIGQMLLVPGTQDTFETHWDIPESLTDGPINIRARLFKPTPSGFEEIADDQVAADLQNRDDAHVGPGNSAQTSPQDETVEIIYPTNASPLGFFRAKGGAWAAAIQASMSDHTSEVSLWYSKTKPGGEAAYTKCANFNGFATTEYTSEPIPFTYGCYLAANDKPSQVTAIAAVTEESDKPDRSDSFQGDPDLSQDSADVHRVSSVYIQDPARMKVDILTDENTSAPSAQGRRGTGGCISFMVSVTDHLDRPVESANVDVHLQGPGDGVQFAGENSPTGSAAPWSSPAKEPDKGHSTEGGAACSSSDSSIGPQGDHNRPGADDVKHLESSTGTGTAAGGNPHEIDSGEFRFHIRSGTGGFSDITAWVDSPPVTEGAAPEADDDAIGQTEPTATYTAQWFSSALRLTIEPTGRTHAVGECVRFIARLRGGAPVPRANVDVHARGPSDSLDFCDPGDATPNRTPVDGEHDAEDAGEATHADDPPRTQHAEGETDSEGNFVFGLVSPETGNTTITAWYDGDPDQDDDAFVSGEASGTSTETWSDATGGPRISFLNPTPYGPTSQNPPSQPTTANGTQVSNKQDTDSAFQIVTRVDSLTPVQGVEILTAPTTAGPFTNLGQATRIGDTDTYELFSPVNVPDGSHVLRAHIVGTNVTADQTVTVNRTTAPADQPGNQQAETLDITAPANGGPAAFRGNKLRVEGVASSGTEGVDFFYTRVGPAVTPASSDWIACGFVQLDGLGSTPQEFSADCTLTPGDQAIQVTGIAAITYDCTEPGCDAATIVETTPAGVTVTTRNPGQKDSGDAHRVFGVETIPLFTVEPPETVGGRDECRKFTVIVEDQNGQGLRDENVDVHLEGPGSSASFCEPPDGSGSTRTAPDGGGHTADPDDGATGIDSGGAVEVLHTEGKTSTAGRFVVGIMSDSLGDSRLVAWLDRNDNDIQDGDESSDSSIMHWEDDPGGGCDIEGTDGPDRLVGTSASERICGFGGNDTIRGRGGNDVILGAAGRDTLRGGGGNDTVRGAGGRDNVFGGGGRDTLFGGADNDTVKGHAGNDTLRGSRGRDVLVGGRGRDRCRGGGGRDRLFSCETGSRNERGFAARRTLI